MRVAHFNTFSHGGAAIAAARIHQGLQQFRRTIVSSSLYCSPEHSSSVPAVSVCDLQPAPLDPIQLNRFSHPVQYQRAKQRRYRIYDQYNKHLANRSSQLETFAMAEMPAATKLNWREINAEIVHLHWISFLADFPSFISSIPNEVPLVWTIHDMNPFTGGCHYSNHCSRYRVGCGNCPQVVNSSPLDVSRSTFENKKQVLRERQVSVVSPSQWLGKLARLSPIWPETTDFRVIHYGLDLHQWSPIDKLLARKQLEIDFEGTLIGFGAADLSSPRKGMPQLLNALSRVQDLSIQKSDKRVAGLMFGGGEVAFDLPLLPLYQTGFVDSIERQRLIYSAVDFMVIPSLEDNQPQIGLEAMACGRPVIGFDSGGLPEFVRDGRTGLLVLPEDETGLVERILRLSQDAELRLKLGAQARQLMEDEFDIAKQSDCYLTLYQNLLQQDGRSCRPIRAA